MVPAAGASSAFGSRLPGGAAVPGAASRFQGVPHIRGAVTRVGRRVIISAVLVSGGGRV